MYIKSDKQAIVLNESLAWDLRQVGQHLADLHSQQIENPRKLAVDVLTRSYLSSFESDFATSDDGRVVYKGTAGREWDT